MAVLLLLLAFTMGHNYAMMVPQHDELCGIIIEDITEYEDNYLEIPPPPGADIFMPDEEFDLFLDEFSKEILPTLPPSDPKWYIEDSYDPNRFIEAWPLIKSDC